MGIREEVKSGKATPENALATLKALRKQGEYVGVDIVRWLERRRGVVVAEKPQTKPRKNKGRNKAAD